MSPKAIGVILLSTLLLLGLAAAAWISRLAAPDDDPISPEGSPTTRSISGRVTVVDDDSQSHAALDGTLDLRIAGEPSTSRVDVRSGAFRFEVPVTAPYLELVRAELDGSEAFVPVEDFERVHPTRIAVPREGTFELRLHRASPRILHVETPERKDASESPPTIEVRLLPGVVDGHDPRVFLADPDDPPITTRSPHRFEGPFPSRICSILARYPGGSWNGCTVDSLLDGDVVLELDDGADLHVEWDEPSGEGEWLTIRDADGSRKILVSLPAVGRREVRVSGLPRIGPVLVHLESGIPRPGLRQYVPVRASGRIDLARGRENHLALVSRSARIRTVESVRREALLTIPDSWPLVDFQLRIESVIGMHLPFVVRSTEMSPVADDPRVLRFAWPATAVGRTLFTIEEFGFRNGLGVDSAVSAPVVLVVPPRAIASIEVVDETGEPLRVTELQWRPRTRRGDPASSWKVAEFDDRDRRFHLEAGASEIELRALGPETPTDPWAAIPESRWKPESGVAPPRVFPLGSDQNDLRFAVTRMCRVEVAFSSKGRRVAPSLRREKLLSIRRSRGPAAGFVRIVRDRIVCWVPDPGRVTIPSIDLAGGLRSPPVELDLERGSNPERIVDLDDSAKQ